MSSQEVQGRTQFARKLVICFKTVNMAYACVILNGKQLNILQHIKHNYIIVL